MVAVCHEQFRSDPCPEAFDEAELRVRETMNALDSELLGAVIEKRDDGASPSLPTSLRHQQPLEFL